MCNLPVLTTELTMWLHTIVSFRRTLDSVLSLIFAVLSYIVFILFLWFETPYIIKFHVHCIDSKELHCPFSITMGAWTMWLIIGNNYSSKGWDKRQLSRIKKKWRSMEQSLLGQVSSGIWNLGITSRKATVPGIWHPQSHVVAGPAVSPLGYLLGWREYFNELLSSFWEHPYYVTEMYDDGKTLTPFAKSDEHQRAFAVSKYAHFRFPCVTIMTLCLLLLSPAPFQLLASPFFLVLIFLGVHSKGLP